MMVVNQQLDTRAVSGGADERKTALDLARPVAHAAQTETAVRFLLDFIDIETAPVVEHLEANGVVEVRQAGVDFGGVCMPHGVADRFAADAQNLLLDDGGCAAWRAFDNDVEVDA